MKPMIAVLVCLWGCASQPPEIASAKNAYKKAASGPAKQRAPEELAQSERTLGTVDSADHPVIASDRAYVAQRQAEKADAVARERIAVDETERNDRLFAQRAISSERQFVSGMEQQRQLATKIEELTEIAQIRQEPRGLVINLSGSVLFASGKDQLLPEAQRSLDDVANALAQRTEDTFTIEGYTDSRGKEEFNEALSERRAAAVKEHLVRRGVADGKVKVVGMGEKNPIASNKTAEGRANNRRVEIVVQKSPGSPTENTQGRP